MKIVLLCSGQHNQMALAHKVAGRLELVGIVVEEKPAKKMASFSLKQLGEKILNRTFFVSLHKAWFGMLEEYKNEYPEFPSTNKIVVPNINTDAAADFIKKVQPDLVMVSGTSMVKKKILELPIPKGIVNLHTGLSPYIKGGPNCTNWCIAENKFHLIGNTVMWIDAGIDSGDIITTECTSLEGNETLAQLHRKVMDHAHSLYVRSLEKIEQSAAQYKGIKQEQINSGVTYYSKQWNLNAKWRLLKNMKAMRSYFKSNKYVADMSSITTVPL
jgi:methionyl-tRNA formyltransferase